MQFEILRNDATPTPISPLRGCRLQNAVRRFVVLLAGTAVVGILLEIVARMTALPSPVGLALEGKNQFWMGGLVGISVLFFWSRPTAGEFFAALGGGLALSVAIFPLCARYDEKQPEVAALNIGLGIAAVLAMSWHAWKRAGAERAEVLALCLPAFMTAGSFFLLAAFFEYSPFRKATLDAETYAAEATFGCQPSFLIGQLFQKCEPLMRISQAVYMIPGFVQLALLGFQVRSRRPPLMDVYTVTVAIAVFFSTACLCFPLVGPRPAFGAAFPNNPPSASEVLAAAPLEVPDEPRNCMPSGHTAWALLIWWHSRPFGRTIRSLGFFNLFFTELATLGSGAHYLLDLVAAVPYAVMVMAICTPLPAKATDSGYWGQRPHLRREAIVCGAVLTLVWFALILYGRDFLAISPVLVWVLALATAAFPMLQEYALYRRVLAYDKSLSEDEVPAAECPGVPQKVLALDERA
jgi:hypothetical protein